MVENLISGPILAQIWAPKGFSWVLSLLDVRHCQKLSLYVISRKTYDPNSRKWWKTSFYTWFRPIVPKFRLPIFFSKIWLRHSLDKQPITGSFKPLCENKNFMKNNISANLCSFWHPQWLRIFEKCSHFQQ